VKEGQLDEKFLIIVGRFIINDSNIFVVSMALIPIIVDRQDKEDEEKYIEGVRISV
jgi:hypothetical protein